MAERTDLDQHGLLLHVCISAKKGICKHEVASANILAGHGLEGDAHAGDWHRQVSLLAHADIEFMRTKGLKLRPGAFGENLVIDGLKTDELGVGTQLRVGPVLLEMTQVGKVCHTRCAIYYTTGDCIMPRTGLFARVLQGGVVLPGMPVTITSRVPRSTIQAAVVTVAGRCSAGKAVDRTGPAVETVLTEELGARVAWKALVPDEPERITESLKDLSDRRIDLIVTVGGNLGAMFVQRETLILNVPGSERAASQKLRAVLPDLSHEIAMLRKKAIHPDGDTGILVMPTSGESQADIVSPVGVPR